MKNYLVICEDSSNLSPVYSLFTTKEKAQEFFEKEIEDNPRIVQTYNEKGVH